MPFDKRKFTKAIKDKYSFKDETFKRVQKDNVKDLVEVEIGDAKTPSKFMPQHKVMRWQNECNVSIRLKDDGNGTETVETREDKIVWKKGKREAHFYDFTNEEHPEGAQEFEIVLLEKPETNVVKFTLQDKDVEYFYQPALDKEFPVGSYDDGKVVAYASETQTKDKDGNTIARRPENVVGSYAVYAKTQKTNWKGGKEYRTGKLGHIFRPRIEDSNGSWIWGELHIENGILSVTIPQSFLDTAVYPVKHAAGLTFGYTTSGASSAGFASNEAVGSFLNTNASADGTVNSVTLGVSGVSGFRSKGFIVNASTLAILTNGVAPGGVVTNGWNTQSFSTPPSVVNGTTYAPFFVMTDGSISIRRDTGGSSGDSKYETDNNYTTPTDPSSLTNSSSKYSIYATYIASGFPVVESVTDTDITSSLTSHVVNMPPTVNAGDRLIAIAHYRNAGTWSTIPTGWTNLAEQAGGGSVGEMLICEKIADGTEDGGTATWITGTGTTAAWQVIRISGAHASTASEVGTTSGDSSAADPPSKSISGWSGENTLWIAVAGHSASSTAAWSAGSLGFTPLVTNGASSGGSACCLSHCYNTDSSDTVNPGAFTVSGSNRWWSAATIAVRPAGGGGGGGSPTPTLMLMGMGT